MKKFLVFLAIAAIVCTFVVLAQTEERGSIQINNMPLGQEVYYVKGDKGFYIPVRAVCEAIGCMVDWIDETQTVVIKRNGEEARIQIGAESFSFEGNGNRYISYRCNPATFIDGKTYAPLSVILECFDGARTHFEDTGLLLIVAYPTYKDASVLVDLGIISQEDFEKDGYITNAEALWTISSAIGWDKDNVDLEEWPRHTRLRDYDKEFKRMVLSLVHGPINYDEIPQIKFEENMTEYEAMLYCTRLIYDTYGCTDPGDRHYTETEDVYFRATMKNIIDTANATNAQNSIERKAFYNILYRTMCYEYSRGGYSLTTDRYICDHFEKTIDLLNN